MKHLRYLRYVLRHKWFVLLACFREGLILRGILHDWHKFLPSEWSPYVWSFNGPWKYKDRPAWLVAAFDLAWLLHQKRGDHHWQAWVLLYDTPTAYIDGKGLQNDGKMRALPMSAGARLEMLCDWYGAGKAQGQTRGWFSTAEWYTKNAGNMVLHAETRTWVEFELARRRTETPWTAPAEAPSAIEPTEAFCPLCFSAEDGGSWGVGERAGFPFEDFLIGVTRALG